jgi:hypothetical protein
MAVPNIFGSATSAIPLSQLDQNFATAITLGNTAVYLGNTTTSLGNLTLTNVTISSGTSNIAANVSTAVGLLPEAQGGTGTTTGYYGFKNRIINGAMVIAQRGTSSLTQSGAFQYPVDRFLIYGDPTSKFTAQQNAGSVTPPAGFKNYLGITSSSAYPVGSADVFVVAQQIEGYNVADLAWGTASAASVTLSFRVYSSLTGTFGGSLRNGAGNRSYPFTYSIPVANTWTTISVTVAGDTSGTWASDNSVGLAVWFGLGVGSAASGTAGAWAGASYFSATGATSVVGTSGATFYITGVQLEKGSTATSFDYRPYGTEFFLCQRYFQKIGVSVVFAGRTSSTTSIVFGCPLATPLRASPTVTNGTLRAFSGGAIVDTTSTATVSSFNGNTILLPLTVAGYTGLTDDRIYNIGISTDGLTLSSEL